MHSLANIVSSAVDKYDKVGKHYYKMQYVAPKADECLT